MSNHKNPDSKDLPDTAIDIPDSDIQPDSEFAGIEGSSKNASNSFKKDALKPKKDASFIEAARKSPSASRGSSYKERKESVRGRAGPHPNTKSRSSQRDSTRYGDSEPEETSEPENFRNAPSSEFPSRDRTLNRARFSNNSAHRKILNDDTDINQESEPNDESEDEQGMTLKDRQEYLNVFHPFGLPLWKPALYKKSRTVTRTAHSALHSIPTAALAFSFGNLVWFLLFGWWTAAVVLLSSVPLLLIPHGGAEYARLLRGLAWYIFWPFNKYVEKITKNAPALPMSADEVPLLGGRPTKSAPGLVPKLAYHIVLHLVVAPVLLFASLVSWLMVFSVPMAKLNYVMVKKLRRIPLRLKFMSGSSMGSEDPLSHPSLCTTYAFGLGYYKYTYDGINILFINLLAVVFFTLLDAQVIARFTDGETGIASQPVIFGCCLISTMPLAYFIGMAVSSISAQSSLGMGAVINATFGSIVEIILYCIALTEGKASLVEGSIIGSMLAGLLLMPGFSMIGGAIKKKQQRFNAKSAGVTSTMLIMSVIGVFVTTLFYSTYATFELRCSGCPDLEPGSSNWACKSCVYYQPHPGDSQFYYERARPLMYICAILLPFAYMVCLLFTLRTHTKLIYSPQSNPSRALQNLYKSLLPTYILQQLHLESAPNPNPPAQEREPNFHDAVAEEPSKVANQPEAQEPSAFDNLDPIPLSVHQSLLDGSHLTHEQNQSIIRHAQVIFDDEDDDEEAVGHDAPEWSKFKSAVILCVCTVLFSLIAEEMVQSVDVVVEGLHIREKILGLTLFALVPNVTEFVNAISFALHGNISLSMEIGSAYTVQVALLQIPALVAFSAYYHWSSPTDPSSQSFTLVFPRLDMFSVLFSVFLITYIYIEGKSNYFKGTILVLTYVVWLSAFMLEPPIDYALGVAAHSALPQRYYV
ncbi:hypothetical protein L0F63_000666 [Massospora cicadina]|nr:hypothetical protein L0F63_000666 [Massospora cicadina]